MPAGKPPHQDGQSHRWQSYEMVLIICLGRAGWERPEPDQVCLYAQECVTKLGFRLHALQL